jgi:hypothetical protein
VHEKKGWTASGNKKKKRESTPDESHSEDEEPSKPVEVPAASVGTMERA